MSTPENMSQLLARDGYSQYEMEPSWRKSPIKRRSRTNISTIESLYVELDENVFLVKENILAYYGTKYNNDNNYHDYVPVYIFKIIPNSRSNDSS